MGPHQPSTSTPYRPEHFKRFGREQPIDRRGQVSRLVGFLGFESLKGMCIYHGLYHSSFLDCHLLNSLSTGLSVHPQHFYDLSTSAPARQPASSRRTVRRTPLLNRGTDIMQPALPFCMIEAYARPALPIPVKTLGMEFAESNTPL